ncbi:MAG: hypothetical protein ACT4OJ_02410 [Bacteroidota bacterium]
MIKNLRKRHRQIWMLWALLLPAGIIMAWLAIPNQPAIKLISEAKENLLPQVAGSADKKDYLVNIRTNNNHTQWQLEWKSKSILEVPSAVIYRIINPAAGISQQQLIGRIEARKDYVFALPADSSGYKELRLVLYDFIHDKKLDSINLIP